MNLGTNMYTLAEELFPICRSITGNGVRQTLQIIQRELPDLTIHEVPTGTSVFDWTIPKEWNIRDAYVANSKGEKVIDFQDNNLHIMGYATPIDCYMTLSELQEHLFSIPKQPDAIPYVTSYYKERWGFCLTQKQRDALVDDTYHVVIDSSLEEGSLTYGEWRLAGESEKEIFLSTYICHPSMANNEVSGPVVATYLAQWIQSLDTRRYSYRIVFIPETIGSITYLSRHLDEMKRRVIAGFNISCVGDNNSYSLLPTRKGKTLADRVAKHTLRYHTPAYKTYSFFKDRGSDERQYCAPGVDLPVVSVMRTKYDEYDEYHTSLDDLSYISGEGLFGAYEAHVKMITALERNVHFVSKTLCEPQLGKRGLYPSASTKNTWEVVQTMMNLWTSMDGETDLLGIAEMIDVPVWELYSIVDDFLENDLIYSLETDTVNEGIRHE